MCYIKQNLPRKVTSYKFPPNLERSFNYKDNIREKENIAPRTL